jgi:hypothetical protein
MDEWPGEQVHEGERVRKNSYLGNNVHCTSQIEHYRPNVAEDDEDELGQRETKKSRRLERLSLMSWISY